MARIAVSEGIDAYYATDSNRTEVDDVLDHETAPYHLTPAELGRWLRKAFEATQTRDAFSLLLERIWMASWLPAIKRHIFASAQTSHLSYMDPSCSYGDPSKRIEHTWAAKTYERRTPLPVPHNRKSNHPALQSSILVDSSGCIVMGFAIDRPLRIKKLTPPGWRFSEMSGYEFLSAIKLIRTRNLDIGPLIAATDDAVKAVADAYLPAHLRRAA